MSAVRRQETRQNRSRPLAVGVLGARRTTAERSQPEWGRKLGEIGRAMAAARECGKTARAWLQGDTAADRIADSGVLRD
jgi:hypothetical protein